MCYTPFLVAAFFLGCLAAVSVGSVQIDVIRRAIKGNLKTSFMVILGAFLADLLYGFVAFFGIAPFLKQEKVMGLLK